MPILTIHTHIKAPAERCFLLSLSVDIHKLSTSGTHEEAIAGVTKGVMKHNDLVTWRAKHLGVFQTMTTRISHYDFPKKFVSEMEKGPFRKLHHQHLFEYGNGETLMTDIFNFEAPFGLAGKIFSSLFLTHYMQRLLEKRNATIKRIAEGSEWKRFIEET